MQKFQKMPNNKGFKASRGLMIFAAVFFVAGFFPVLSAEGSGLSLNSYTLPGDGSIRYWDNTKFVPARNSSQGRNGPASGVNTDPLAEGATGWNDGTNWVVARTFLPFDTSALPQDAVISRAVLHLKGRKYVKGGSVSLVFSNQASPSTLTDRDYGSVTFSRAAEDINTEIFSPTASMQAWPLNASGIAGIKKGGVTKLAIVSADDFNGTEPVTGGAHNFGLADIATSRARQGDRPYLEIYYDQSQNIPSLPATLPTPTPFPTAIPEPPSLAPVLPRPNLPFKNPEGSALYRQPYQNLSFSIPVGGQYFYGLGDDRKSTLHLRKGMNIYLINFQNLGMVKMREEIQKLGLNESGSYPLYSSRGFSEISLKVQAAGLPQNVNLSQNTFVIAPTDGNYLINLGKAVFQESAGFDPNIISLRYNIGDLQTAGFVSFLKEPIFFKQVLTSKKALNIIQDFPAGNFYLVNNEKATARQIAAEDALVLSGAGIGKEKISTSFNQGLAASLGLEFFSGLEEGVQWLATYGETGEVVTRTISPNNSFASDLTSSITGSIFKAPSLASNLAAAGASPYQIAALVSVAPTADQAAKAILDASFGGGQTALQNSNYAQTSQQLASLLGIAEVRPVNMPFASGISGQSSSVLSSPEAGSLLYLPNDMGFVCFMTSCHIASADHTGLSLAGLPVVPQAFESWKIPYMNLGTNVFSTLAQAHTTSQTSEQVRLNFLKLFPSLPLVRATAFENLLPNIRWQSQFDGSINQAEKCLVTSEAVAGYKTSWENSIVAASFSSQAGTVVSQAGAKQALEEIERTLVGRKLPIIVGVSRGNEPGVTNGLQNSLASNATAHYIVIVGWGKDGKGKYYRYYDVGTGHESLGASPLAKLYLDESAYLLKGKRVYSPESNITYTVTEVRPRP